MRDFVTTFQPRTILCQIAWISQIQGELLNILVLLKRAWLKRTWVKKTLVRLAFIPRSYNQRCMVHKSRITNIWIAHEFLVNFTSGQSARTQGENSNYSSHSWPKFAQGNELFHSQFWMNHYTISKYSMNQSNNLLETVFWLLWKNKYQAQFRFRMNWYYLDGEQIAFMLNEHWAQWGEGSEQLPW